MARKFEATCRDNHIALVRVDMSAASGASGKREREGEKGVREDGEKGKRERQKGRGREGEKECERKSGRGVSAGERREENETERETKRAPTKLLLGTSLACDWYKTLYAPSRTDCSFMFVVDRDGKFSGPPPERERVRGREGGREIETREESLRKKERKRIRRWRDEKKNLSVSFCLQTERVDNTGNRYAIKQIQSPDTSPVTSLTFFDRTRFVTASANGPLRVYKTPTRELLFASSKANIGTVSSMCIVSGANHIALATDTSHALSLFDLSASSSLSEPKQIELSSNLLSGSWSPFVKLISPEPNALFFCTANGIEFIDVRSESSRVLISKKPNEGDLIDFDIEEGKTLFATCSSSSVQIFDVRKVSHADTASPLHSFNWKNLTSVLLRKSVCFPGDTEGNIVSWKFETGREERRKGHCGAVRFFSKISSTLFLSASEDTTIALWREPDDQPSRLFTFEHTFRSHLVPITSLCANETYFLSGDASGRISLWEYQQNRTVKPFSIL